MINVMELIKGQRLICLSLRMRISEIEQILKTTRHSGYPIIGKGQLLRIFTVDYRTPISQRGFQIDASEMALLANQIPFAGY